MLNPIISNIVFFTEMLISYIFFSNMFEKKIATFKCLGIGCLLCSVCSIANLVSGNNGIVNIVTGTLVNIFFCRICFDHGFKLSIFYSVILSAINAAIETVVISTVVALTGSDFFAYNTNFPLLILECSTSKILYFFVVLTFAKVVKRNTGKAKLPFNLFLYPVCTGVCVMIFWCINTMPDTPYTTQSLLAFASLFLLAATILLFVTYQHQLERDNETLQMKAEFEKLRTEQSYFQILEYQNQQLMIYAHDAKNHLAAIESLNQDPQISRYVSKLSHQLADYTKIGHSGNKLLDIIIQKYCANCELKQIHFEYDVKLCNLSNVEDMDLVAILGNLMDNAITAAEKSRKKTVSLATAKRNSYSILVVTNSCDSQPQANGRKLITSKDDSSLHGFGLKSVRKTLKKYQGDFDWDYDEKNNTFTITVMIGEPVRPKTE